METAGVNRTHADQARSHHKAHGPSEVSEPPTLSLLPLHGPSRASTVQRRSSSSLSLSLSPMDVSLTFAPSASPHRHRRLLPPAGRSGGGGGARRLSTARRRREATSGELRAAAGPNGRGRGHAASVPVHKVTVHDRQRGVVHEFSVPEVRILRGGRCRRIVAFLLRFPAILSLGSYTEIM